MLQALSFACSAKSLATLADKADQSGSGRPLHPSCPGCSTGQPPGQPTIYYWYLLYSLRSLLALVYSLFALPAHSVRRPFTVGRFTSLSGSYSLVLPLFYILMLHCSLPLVLHYLAVFLPLPFQFVSFIAVLFLYAFIKLIYVSLLAYFSCYFV